MPAPPVLSLVAPHRDPQPDAWSSLMLRIARERGMTWQQIAFGLGLGSAQAARQRYERLVERVDT